MKMAGIRNQVVDSAGDIDCPRWLTLSRSDQGGDWQALALLVMGGLPFVGEAGGWYSDLIPAKAH
jgi:hypothetical protein